MQPKMVALQTHVEVNATLLKHHININCIHVWISTWLQNLLQHFEWSWLSRRLISLLVFLQHFVDLRVCHYWWQKTGGIWAEKQITTINTSLHTMSPILHRRSQITDKQMMVMGPHTSLCFLEPQLKLSLTYCNAYCKHLTRENAVHSATVRHIVTWKTLPSG